MLIKGLQPLTLVDFPGHLSCIVFTPGCNMRCSYCYNKDLLLNSSSLPTIKEPEFFTFLESRKNLLDGVAITGGEPTLHPDLPEFIRKIKDLGFKIKLDTNGTKPQMIKSLIQEGLVDYIAMDIKSSIGDYNNVTNVPLELDSIKETAKLIMKSEVDYEFRTTVVPGLFSEDNAKSIGEWLKGAKKYCLQHFKPMDTMIDSSLCNVTPYSEEKLQEFAEIMSKYIKTVEVRGS